MVARREADEVPEEFSRALAAIRAATPRSEVVLEETPRRSGWPRTPWR